LKALGKSTEVIVIVDDDEPLREGLGSVLKAAGFSVANFGSAEQFLNILDFVTAHGDDRLRDVLLKTGAVAFLTKPVRSDALLKEIRAALSRVTED
jgi:FixJ family two-component response regulator